MKTTSAIPAAGLASIAMCNMEPGATTYMCQVVQWDATSLFTNGIWSGLTKIPEFGNSSTLMEQLGLTSIACGDSTAGTASILPALTSSCISKLLTWNTPATKKTDMEIDWAFIYASTFASEDLLNTANSQEAAAYAKTSVTAYFNTDSTKTTTASVATGTYNLFESGAYAVAALGAGLALLAAF